MGLLSWLKGRFRKTPPAPAVVELPDVASEYVYIQRLKCEKCRGATTGKRHGSGSGENGRMNDFWTVTCGKCGTAKSLTLSVPGMGGLSQGQVQDIMNGVREKLAQGKPLQDVLQEIANKSIERGLQNPADGGK
jgi:hypothetical protein